MYTYACIYNLNSFICIYFSTTIFLTNGNVYSIYYILYMNMIFISVITLVWLHSYLSIHKKHLSIKDIYVHKICCSPLIFFNKIKIIQNLVRVVISVHQDLILTHPNNTVILKCYYFLVFISNPCLTFVFSS